MKTIKASLYFCVALSLGACSEKVSVEEHLLAAQNYLAQNKTNESIIELKNAIRADNQNSEARFLLGRTYLNLGDGISAVKELERAKQLKYDDNAVIPLLARAYIITERSIDVLDLTEASSKLTSQAQNHFLAYKSLAAIKSNDLPVAIQSIKLAESIDKNSMYTYLAQAYLAVNNEELEQADVLLSKIFAIKEQQVDALMLRGQLSMLTNNYAQAAKSFKAYLALQPKSGLVNLLLADALLQSGQDEEAEKYADNILAKVQSQPFAHYIKAMTAFNRKDFEKASEHAELALSANFNQVNLKLVAGASAFYLNNWQQSYRHFKDIVGYLPKEHKARHMLAVTQLELGLIDEISNTLGGEDNSNIEDTEFLSVLSYKLLKLGATDEAKRLLAQNDDVTLQTADESARQGMLKLMMNDPSGIQHLENAITLDPNFTGAELALAYAFLEKNEVVKAKEIAEKLQKKQLEDVSYFSLMGSIAIKEKKFDEAESYFAKALKIEPDNIFALTEQLRLAREQKNIPLSQERADYLIKVAPNNNKVLRHYFGVYQNEMALEKLKASYQTDISDESKALILSEAMLSLGQYQPAEEVLLNIANTNKLSKRYWQVLITVYQNKKEPQKVRETLEQWIKVSPYHIEPVALLANFYTTYRQHKKALKVIKKGLNYHKDNLILQLIQLQLLLDDKQIIEAKKQYKLLATAEINVALNDGFQGQIYLHEQKFKQAVPKLTTLYETYPNSQNAQYLASAYFGSDEESKAISVLEQHLMRNVNDNKIRTILAGIYLKNDTEKAITTYEEIVNKQSNNVIAHNNLAWLYLEKDDNENALIHIEKAYELAPNVANISDTYGKVLLNLGDKRGALKYLSEAMELAKGKDKSIQLNYIEALIANSRTNEARDLLQKVSPDTEEQTAMKVKLQSTLSN